MVFRFLDLPSELRNRIYEIAAAAGDEPLVISRRPHREDGNYAGLTRACVQIRAEYRPMQRRRAKLSVGFSDLDDFTRTFLASAADKMTLPLEVHVRVSRLPNPGCALIFDSLPILEVKVANPRLDIRIVPLDVPFKFRFLQSGPYNLTIQTIQTTIALTQTQDLNALLLHSNKDWHACISNGSIDEVYIEMFSGFTRVEIVFVGKGLGFRDWQETMRDPEEWRMSHGLQGPTSSHIHRLDVSFHHYEE